MDNLLLIANRLVTERKRLGLQQTDVCESLGFSIPTLSRYENGKRSPELVDCLALARLGYDMYFVLTGERLAVAHSDLSADEINWLDLYRKSVHKAVLMQMVRGFESMSEQKG